MQRVIRWSASLGLVVLWTARAAASPTFASAVTNGIVNVAGLTEASGVVASRNNPGVVWTHNDSGHPAQVFALDTQGRLLGAYPIPGNTDNEDIAIGPGPISNVDYLYVGDIGDNFSNRSNIKVYQIPEPTVYSSQFSAPITATMKGARTITLTYPEGPRNAEALFVDPLTGDLFIATKEAISRIYTAPKAQLDTNNSFTLTFVRTLAFDVPSGADISPAGNEIVIRRENVADLWTRANGQSINDALSGPAISIPVTGTANGEPNGEAIGFDAIGSGYFTLSDSASIQPLRYFARSSNDGPPVPVSLVGAASSWNYLDDGSDQGTAWRIPGFNDLGWSDGNTQFGYGEGDEATLVSFGPNSANKYITTYFRTQFALDNPGDLTNLKLKLVASPGAAIFLNGTPVWYHYLATNANFHTLASPEPAAGLEDAWVTLPLDAALLRNGINTLAVEVHLAAPTNTALSFDAQLVADSQGTAYEPFDYPAGTSLVLVTNKTGQWWTAAGTGATTATVTNGNLAVAGLSSSMGAAMNFGAVDGPSARFNLISNVTSGTLYYSFALKVTSLGALSSVGGPLAAFNNSRGPQPTTPAVLGTRLLARTAGADVFNLGVAKNTNSPTEWFWATNVFHLQETIFVVGSYIFNPNTSTDDISLLWLNPSVTEFGSNLPPAATLSASAGADITANQIASFVFLQTGLNNTNQPGTMTADELRIGFTWASVTPRGIMPPTLNVAGQRGAIVLTWPLTAPDFVLERATTLGPTNYWTTVSLPAPILGDHFVVTNATTTAASFFRLRK